MKIELNIANTENVQSLSNEDIEQIDEIMNALITTGALTGVKNGQTVIHFDHTGTFQRVELRYFPWQRRRKSNESR